MPSETISDEVLMRRFREAFDEAALDEIIARYYRPALTIAREMTGQSSSAEDAVQEAFIRTVRNRDRFDPGRSFASWFYTILRNVCVDMRRGETRRADQLRELAEQGGNSVQQPDSHGDFMAILEPLEPAEREILIYRFVHGMTFQEIAIQLDITVEAAKKRAQRALIHLRAGPSTMLPASLGSFAEARRAGPSSILRASPSTTLPASLGSFAEARRAGAAGRKASGS